MYTDEAKQLRDKYNLDADVLQIAHAIKSTALASEIPYHRVYNKEVLGRPATVKTMEDIPEYVNAKKVTKMASKVCYFLLVFSRSITSSNQYYYF